jgi:hypothetical protein
MLKLVFVLLWYCCAGDILLLPIINPDYPKVMEMNSVMGGFQSMRVADEDFDFTFRGSAWQECQGIDAVDGTIEIVACSLQRDRSMIGLIHGHLWRACPGGAFVVPIGSSQVGEVIEDAISEWDGEDSSSLAEGCHPGPYRIVDARWRMQDCPLPDTQAVKYAGGAYDRVDTEFNLGSQRWMQDWPVEVSNPERVEEFCAFYDRETDPIVRFDTMQLALDSYNDRLQWDPVRSAWFDRTLRQDFALHGHTVIQWAALRYEKDHPELFSPNPEFVCKCSGMLRLIWEESLIPIELQWQPSN